MEHWLFQFAWLLGLGSNSGRLLGSRTSVVPGRQGGGNVDFVWTLDKNRITRLSPTVGGGWDEEEDSIKTLSWILGWNGFLICSVKGTTRNYQARSGVIENTDHTH